MSKFTEVVVEKREGSKTLTDYATSPAHLVRLQHQGFVVRETPAVDDIEKPADTHRPRKP